MLELEEQELLQKYAYQSWLERGRPLGSPEIDWEKAKAMLQEHYSQGLKALDDAAVERLLVDTEQVPGSEAIDTAIVDANLVERKLEASRFVPRKTKERQPGSTRARATTRP